MTMKMNFQFNEVHRLAENMGSLSDGEGERFHQDIEEIETRYLCRWVISMMADYCWSLKIYERLSYCVAFPS